MKVCSLLGNVVLTYFGKWDFVEPLEKPELASQLYVAPGESGWARETRVILLSVRAARVGGRLTGC